jgi:hypothetical protein
MLPLLMGPSRGAITRIYLGLVIGVVAVVVLLVWPGYLSSYSCAWSIDPTTSVNDHTYCYESVRMPGANLTMSGPVFGTFQYRAWGFGFSLEWLGASQLNISVTEPNGSTYSGELSMSYACPAGGCNFTRIGPPTWFTPDGAAGISVYWIPVPVGANVTLYVEK